MYRREKMMQDMAMAAPPPMVGMAADAEELGVTIEAQYEVGEYDILILSAEESNGLIKWLNQNGYKIPDGAEETVGAYLKRGMKFFVAKVNLDRHDGSGVLRPIQVAYEDEDFIETDLAELMAGAIKTAFASLEPDVLVMLKLSFIHGVSQTDIARMWQCDQTRVSRTLSTARSQIAAETMRAIRAAEPDLQIDWDDFKRLCAYGIEI